MFSLSSESQTQQTPGVGEQFVSEQIPVGLPWRILLLSGTLFAFSIFAFVGIKFGYTAYLKSQAISLSKQIDELASRVSSEDQEEIVNFYSQVVNLEKVLGSHKFYSNIFSFLEENTLPSIYYTEALIDAAEESLTIRGAARTAQDLIQQLDVFDKSNVLKRVVLDTTSFDQGKTLFGVSLTFDTNFFERPIESSDAF